MKRLMEGNKEKVKRSKAYTSVPSHETYTFEHIVDGFVKDAKEHLVTYLQRKKDVRSEVKDFMRSPKRVLAKALRAYDCSLYELLKELSLKRKLKNEESCTQSVDHDESWARDSVSRRTIRRHSSRSLH
jgi:hypothetical protein